MGVLVEAGAEIDAKTAHGWTSLSMAVGRGHADTVRVLLEAGADVDCSYLGMSALRLATVSGHTAIVQLLMKAGARQ